VTKMDNPVPQLRNLVSPGSNRLAAFPTSPVAAEASREHLANQVRRSSPEETIHGHSRRRRIRREVPRCLPREMPGRLLYERLARGSGLEDPTDVVALSEDGSTCGESKIVVHLDGILRRTGEHELFGAVCVAACGAARPEIDVRHQRGTFGVPITVSILINNYVRGRELLATHRGAQLL